MQIQELLRLADWFKENVVDEKIPNFYKNLHNKMNQNANANNNQPKQPFEQDKENLLNALETVNLNLLTLEQIGFLEQLEIIELLGQDGISNIENVLYENNLDIATAAKKIGEFSNKIANAQTTLSEIEATLSKSFSIEDDEELPEDSVLMRVYFQEGAAMNNINDFKKLGAAWYDIGRGIAIAQNRSPEDFNIIGAQKGSVILEMAVYAGVATSVSTILLAGLKVADRVLDILKKAEELKALKLSNKKIEQEIKKEADKEKENGIQTILDTAIEKLELNPEQDGDKVNALKKSITKLIDFTQKGGAVDFVQPEDEEESEDGENGENGMREEMMKLKTDVQEIRKLENKIKLLESKVGKEKN